MKINIFTKILALSIFTVATFFGFLASPASAEVPANTADYYSARISDGDRNIINPILDQNCGKLNLDDTDVIVGDCSWFRNTFYLYKYLGQAGFMPSLGVDANSSSEVKAAWTKVRDLYGSFSKSNVQNGYQYINWKLNPDSSSADLYVDQRTACEIDPTGVGCDQPPPVVAGVCYAPQARSGVFLMYAECVATDVYAELKSMATMGMIPGSSEGSNYLAMPKKLILDSISQGTFDPVDEWYFAWQHLTGFYYNIYAYIEANGGSSGDKDNANASSLLIKARLEEAQTPVTPTPTTSYCTGEAAPGSGTSTFYKTVSSGSDAGDRFVVCYASNSARLGTAMIDKIKSTPLTSQYYLGGSDYLLLPKTMNTFVFNPTDQTKEISAWNAVADAYTEIMGSANALSNSSDATAAQTSITNIRASIATGSKLAFTVSSDNKYFIVDQAYIASTIPPQYTNYLKTIGLLIYPYSDSGPLTAGVLRDVSATAVPVVANDLQAEALTNAENLYLAIRNAAPANDKTNYDFAEHARINLAAAVQKYRDQQTILDDGDVLVVPDSATVDQGDAVKITFSYVNDAVDSQLRFKVYVSDKDESTWLGSPHHVENFPAGVSGDYTFDWTWQTTVADTAITKHLIRADVWAIDTGAEVAKIATGSAEVTVLIEGQSDVKWAFDPSQEIKLGTSVTISYTITGHDGQTGQLYIKDCKDTGWPKGDTIASIVSGITYSFTWDTATSGTESCNHKLGLTMGPTALSNSCIEVYPADGEPTHSCVGADGVPVTPPPTGGTTEVEGGQFLKIVGDWLGRAVGQPLKATTVMGFLKMVIEYWFPILITLGAFFGLVAGGIMYITSGGDDAITTKAKKTLIYSVIGLVVAALSWGIVTATIDLLGRKP